MYKHRSEPVFFLQLLGQSGSKLYRGGQKGDDRMSLLYRIRTYEGHSCTISCN